MTGQVAACRDVAGEVRLPLFYFWTPRPGHVGSRCAARVDSPRFSVVQERSSTLRLVETSVVRHLDWKNLEEMCLLEQWKGGRLRARDLSWEMSNLQRNMVRMPLARW